MVLPTPDYDLFVQALTENIKKMNLQPVPWFIGKIIQVCFHILTSGEIFSSISDVVKNAEVLFISFFV